MRTSILAIRIARSLGLVNKQTGGEVIRALQFLNAAYLFLVYAIEYNSKSFARLIYLLLRVEVVHESRTSSSQELLLGVLAKAVSASRIRLCLVVL